MLRVGILGDLDSVLGFKSIGFEVFPVADAQEAGPLLHRLAEQDFAVLYLTEQLAADMGKDLERFRNSRLPAIIPVPGVRGSLGIGMQGVRQCVEKAVGADILFKDEAADTPMEK